MGVYYHPDFFNKSDLTKGIEGNKLHYGRLKLIQDNIKPNGSILDVGCANGFFCFAFNKTHSPIVGIDYTRERIDSCNESVKKHNIAGIKFIYSNIMNDKSQFKTRWDTIFYLSSHQHVLVKYGFEEANKLLKKLSENCLEMFFDMGQKDEIGLRHNDWYPLLPDVKCIEDWMFEYLKENTVCKSINSIGKMNRIMWHLKCNI